jgi:hypothetical protein
MSVFEHGDAVRTTLDGTNRNGRRVDFHLRARIAHHTEDYRASPYLNLIPFCGQFADFDFRIRRKTQHIGGIELNLDSRAWCGADDVARHERRIYRGGGLFTRIASLNGDISIDNANARYSVFRTVIAIKIRTFLSLESGDRSGQDQGHEE